MWGKLLKKIAEPSSHAGAGLVALATMFGVPANTAQAVAQAVVALAGVGAIVLTESK
uniref:Holin n=1 Tax=Corticoviridae sp. TaxID=2832474 RepID=A0A8D9PE40_9VIRU|nr:MAG TPA: hypothetical protein [Corticoviridae sp.]